MSGRSNVVRLNVRKSRNASTADTASPQYTDQYANGSGVTSGHDPAMLRTRSASSMTNNETLYTTSGRPARAAKQEVSYNEETIINRAFTGLPPVALATNPYAQYYAQQAPVQVVPAQNSAYSTRRGNVAATPAFSAHQQQQYPTASSSNVDYGKFAEFNGDDSDYLDAKGYPNGKAEGDYEEEGEEEEEEEDYVDDDDEEYGSVNKSGRANNSRKSGKKVARSSSGKANGINAGSTKPSNARRRPSRADEDPDGDWHDRTDPDSVEVVSANNSFTMEGVKSARVQIPQQSLYVQPPNDYARNLANVHNGAPLPYLNIPPPKPSSNGHITSPSYSTHQAQSPHTIPDSDDPGTAEQLAQTLFPHNPVQQRRPTRVPQSEEDGEGEDADGSADPLAHPPQAMITNVQYAPNGKMYAQAQVSAYLPPPEPKTESYRTSSGRRTTVRHVVDSEDDTDDSLNLKKKTRSKAAKTYAGEVDVDEEDEYHEDPEEEYEPGGGGRLTRQRKLQALANKNRAKSKSTRASSRGARRSSRRKDDDEDDEYAEPSRNARFASSSASDDGSPDLNDDESEDDLMKNLQSQDTERYSKRNRSEVNYNVAAMFGLDANGKPLPKEGGNDTEKVKKKKRPTYGAPKRLPFNMSGKQLGSLFGEAPPDSDSDDDNGMTPKRTGLLGNGAAGAFALPGSGFEFSASTSNNLGKISGATNLADIDPLLPATTLSFDQVGGLQSHIQQLKEMVALPLLYPELFQRFGVTPPRGVLFHGPPGTGKTLLARALAASCSSEGQKISFFMRKGADVLSKWVGEAERQLRLLFEEAKNCQPSIIFFDEIDGLAPVRSSKQDQIHASIVSTMLALMDGMDGRGQVIVIGATNRPDAVDPALRRPGRFDREFYFPLPDFDARRKIIQINTRSWEPPLADDFLDELADLTKGYGGADLRALCTEAALTAIQRKYPQIYKTSDRLVIEPNEIRPVARDFITSAKNLIPSTARSASSLAAPLQPHLKPLLTHSYETVVASLRKTLPEVKKVNVLEEAEYEPHGDGGFEQEKAMQTFENLRIFRPRLLITGSAGMGQAAVGAAVLHHLEGFHVQSLDFATLVGDTARTSEAAVVQIFTEAKRHKPSILYIPSLSGWAAAVPDSVKTTVRSLLDSLDPSDPVLLLAIAECPFSEIPPDVRSWFGFLRNNRVTLQAPTDVMREAFFEQTLQAMQRRPSDYPDAMPRKKRVLEKLAIAPPLPPREPTAAELQQQEQNDARLREYLKFRLGPIIIELKKRYKRFCKAIGDGAEIDVLPPGAAENSPEGVALALADEAVPPPAPPAETRPDQPLTNGHAGDEEMDTDVVHVSATARQSVGPQPNPHAAEAEVEAPQAAAGEAAVTAIAAEPVSAGYKFRFHDIGLDKINDRLYADRYHTPDMFLADIQRVVENAYHDDEADSASKADQMLNHTRVMVDQVCDGQFRLECSRMAERDKERSKKAKEARAKEKEAIAAQAQAAGAAVADEVGKDMATTSSRPSAAVQTHSTESETGLNPLKRPHVSESPYNSNKRSRTDAMQIDIDGGVADSPLHQRAGGIAASSRTMSVGNLLAPEAAQGDRMTAQGASVDEPRLASPPPAPLPDFILPDEQLQSLGRFLVKNTGSLSIDHLEQLRAACYDCIWQARREWNKMSLVAEIRALADDFISEVEAAENDD